MKTAGIVRKIDELGRIVIPIELRKSVGIGKREPIEIILEEDRVIIKKFESGCCFCGTETGIQMFKDNKVCEQCLEEISST